jgi:hypothetical protein
MKRPSGWQVRAQANHVEPPVPPAGFDVLLSRLGIKEKDAAKNALVKQWVRQHYHTRFVPEKILEAVGVREVSV